MVVVGSEAGIEHTFEGIDPGVGVARVELVHDGVGDALNGGGDALWRWDPRCSGAVTRRLWSLGGKTAGSQKEEEQDARDQGALSGGWQRCGTHRFTAPGRDEQRHGRESPSRRATIHQDAHVFH